MKNSRLCLVAAVALGSFACSGGGGGDGGGGGGDEACGGSSGGDQRPTTSGTIAYVRGNELRLVEPDGSGDHLVWRAPDVPISPYHLTAPAWRPNGWEIAFASDHEMAYSIFERDLYAIRPDGGGLRRLTNAPMREQLASCRKGTVRATIQNVDVYSYSLFIVIMQGAAPQTVTIPPGSRVTVTFADVADLGDVAQPIVAANGMLRWIGAFADVKAGQTIDATGMVQIYENGTIRGYGADDPFWRSDSSKLGYVGSYCLLLQVPSNPAGGAWYEPLVSSDAFFNTCRVEWGPTAATADQLIAKDGSDYFDRSVIHLITMKEGATSKPAPLITLDPYIQVTDLHWLRDGSGFVFARTNSLFERDVNLWEFRFASGTATQLTDLHLAERVMRRFSMSPDGTRIAFETVDREDPDELFATSAELWVMNRDGSGLALLARDARHPAWNPLGGGDGPGQRTVSGTVTYDFLPARYDPVNETGGFGTSTEKPVRAAVVQAMRGAMVLGTPTSTDASGHYALTFDDPGGTGDLAIVVLARTSGTPSIQVQDNTDGNAIWAIGAPLDGNATTLNLRATSGWTGTRFEAERRTAAPFAVLDSMYTAAAAYVAARPSVAFPALHVNWSPRNAPGGDGSTPSTGNIGTSHFSRQDNQIYVLGADQVDTDEYDSHVIVHEWAHFFDNNLSRSDSPGGSHGPGDLLDPRLAFAEGHATALAAMVLAESMYVDTSWSGPGGALAAFGFDAETEPSPTDDPKPGAFSESSVMRLLYDLFDPANEAFDGISLGLGRVYDVLTGHQKSTPFLTTIASFVTGVRALAGVNGPALDALLARYEIGPITTDYGTGDRLGGGTGGLEAMYVHVTELPTTTGIQLGGAESANKWSQNQYYWFTGTGGPVRIEVTSAEDVMLHGYEGGRDLGYVDDLEGGGTERVAVSTTAGTIYVVDLVGFPTPNANDITLRFTTP